MTVPGPARRSAGRGGRGRRPRLLAAACGSTPPRAPPPPGPAAASAPPLAASVTATGGDQLGRAGDGRLPGGTADNFWQLLHARPAVARWAPGDPARRRRTTAAWSPRRRVTGRLTAGFRPSQDLTFSPLATTRDARRQWAPGLLLDAGLTATARRRWRPGARRTAAGADRPRPGAGHRARRALAGRAHQPGALGRGPRSGRRLRADRADRGRVQPGRDAAAAGRAAAPARPGSFRSPAGAGAPPGPCCRPAWPRPTGSPCLRRWPRPGPARWRCSATRGRASLAAWAPPGGPWRAVRAAGGSAARRSGRPLPDRVAPAACVLGTGLGATVAPVGGPWRGGRGCAVAPAARAARAQRGPGARPGRGEVSALAPAGWFHRSAWQSVSAPPWVRQRVLDAPGATVRLVRLSA